jgi:hypothetical protein
MKRIILIFLLALGYVYGNAQAPLVNRFGQDTLVFEGDEFEQTTEIYIKIPNYQDSAQVLYNIGRGRVAWFPTASLPGGGGGGGGTWGSITGTLSNQTDLQTALNGKANTSHTHDDRYFTETESNVSFAPISHNHNTLYFTEAEIIAGYATIGHDHDADYATLAHTHDTRYYTETEIDGLLANKVTVVVGKQLSTEDYTTVEKTKLAGIATGATANQTDAYLLDLGNHTGTLAFARITNDATHRWLTDAQISTWDAKQAQLNGTGFVKATGTTITYDNSTYSLSTHDHDGVYSLTGHNHAGVYQPADGDLTTWAGITPAAWAQSMLGTANPGAIRFFRVTAGNIFEFRTSAEMLGDIGAAASGHNHDGVYSPTTHNHDATYSPLAHNHDATYAPLVHNHDAAYAALTHNHDDRYYTETEANTLLDAKVNYVDSRLSGDVRMEFDATNYTKFLQTTEGKTIVTHVGGTGPEFYFDMPVFFNGAIKLPNADIGEVLQINESGNVISAPFDAPPLATGNYNHITLVSETDWQLTAAAMTAIRDEFETNGINASLIPISNLTLSMFAAGEFDPDDQDIIDIAALTPSTNDFMVRGATAWESKTVAQTKTILAYSTTDVSEGTNLYYTDARARGSISLTTTGTSGAATYNSSTGVLNIPQYTGGGSSSWGGITGTLGDQTDLQAALDAKAPLGSSNNFTAPQTITSTTSPQFKLAYDGTYYVDFSVSNTGNLTLNYNGSGAFVFSDMVYATAGMGTSTTRENGNLSVWSGGGSVSTTNAALLFDGASTVHVRTSLRGSTVTSPVAGSSYAGIIIGDQGINTAASGIHETVAGMVMKTQGAVSGAGSITNAYNLWIQGGWTGTETPTGDNMSLRSDGINSMERLFVGYHGSGLGGSSGTSIRSMIGGTFANSGTASAVGLGIFPYFQSSGSGTDYLISAGTSTAQWPGGSQTVYFTVDKTGFVWGGGGFGTSPIAKPAAKTVTQIYVDNGFGGEALGQKSNSGGNTFDDYTFAPGASSMRHVSGSFQSNSTGGYTNVGMNEGAGTTTASSIGTTNTNLFTTINRSAISTAATSGAVAGKYGNGNKWLLSNTAGVGGFIYTTYLGSASTVATQRTFAGLYQSTSMPANADPSSFLRTIGLGNDAADGNMQIMHNDNSGAATKIDLGANFPAKTSSVDWYKLTLKAYPGNASAVYYRVERMNTGDVATGTLTTNLPESNQFLNWHYFVGNGTTASAATIHFSGHDMYTRL